MTIEKMTVSLLPYPLASARGGSGVSLVDVIVCEIMSGDGLAGFGFSYAIGGRGAAAVTAVKALGAEVVLGKAREHPEMAWRRLKAACNRTGWGPNFVGLAALDVALWDIHAKSLNLPLGLAMGGAARAVPVYGSGGYHPGQTDADIIEQVERHKAQGFKAVKLRLSGTPQDVRAIKAARSAMSQEQHLMIDMNEKGSLTSARFLIEAALDQGSLFVEEPLPANNIDGYRALARAFPGMVATGEHLQGSEAAFPFLREGLCGAIQPDLAMMGGLTETLRLARAAEFFGIEVMPHFLPSLFVHLANAMPGVTWLEDFPLLEPLLEGVQIPAKDGTLTASADPGHGLRLRQDVRARMISG